MRSHIKANIKAIWLGYLMVSVVQGPLAWAQPNIVPLPSPGGAQRRRAPQPAGKTPIVPQRGARPLPPGTTATGVGKPSVPAPGTTVAASANAPGTVEIPGEKEFNSCKKMPAGQRNVKFNFKPDSEMSDLIGWISAITCTQFLIPSGVQIQGKKVTIISPQKITPEEAYRLFLAALESVQLTVEPMGKWGFRIVDAARAKFTNLPFYKDGEKGPSDKRFVTRMIRLEHLDPNDVVPNVLNRIKGEQGDIIAYQNSIIVTDQAVIIDRLMDVLKEIDVPQATTDKIWMLRIKNASATEMASRLAEIFQVQQMGTGGRRQGGIGGAPIGPAPAPPAAPGARPGQAKKLGTDLVSQMTVTKIIPDDRSNHLIVIANDLAYEWLLTMVKKLDAPLEGGGDGRVHIYYCENANCDELAATLGSVTGVSVVGSAGARRQRTSTSGAGAVAAPIPTPMPTGANGQQQGQSLLFEGEVRITPDVATNALLVVSTLKDFQALRKVIVRLDEPRKQVFVEALIMEVLLDKSRKVGVNYHAGFPQSVGGKESLVLGGFGANKTLSPASLVADPALMGLSGALFGPAINAASTKLFGVTTDIPSFGVFVHFLQDNNDINVLSNPHLLITNNQEGEISVGQNLPFPGALLPSFGGLGAAGGGLGGLGSVSVQRQDVALKMKLIPSVNEHNMIRLDVDQEISDVASPNYNGLGPATSKRTAKTQVVCKDQQTVVIGGLMSDRTTEHIQKVPILGDIPVLGFFFRNTERQVQKTNIIIALTPYVITDTSDLRRVVEKKMRERREFLERYSAIEDTMQNMEVDVDYRRKRGMLEEINRSAREIDEEEEELRKLHERDQQEESTPIELRGGKKRPVGQGKSDGDETTAGDSVPVLLRRPTDGATVTTAPAAHPQPQN